MVVSSLGRGRIAVGVGKMVGLMLSGVFITAEAGLSVAVPIGGEAIVPVQPIVNKMINKIKNKREIIKPPFINAARIIVGNVGQVNRYYFNDSNQILMYSPRISYLLAISYS